MSLDGELQLPPRPGLPTVLGAPWSWGPRAPCCPPSWGPPGSWAPRPHSGCWLLCSAWMLTRALSLQPWSRKTREGGVRLLHPRGRGLPGA